MLTPKELNNKIERHWSSGRVLRAWMDLEPDLFPLRIGVGRPSARVMMDDFDQVRRWKQELEQGCTAGGYSIEYRETNHRQLGRQRLPGQLLFETPDAVITCLGKSRLFERFKQCHDLIIRQQPLLQAWLQAHPMKALEQDVDWERLLLVIAFFQSHPLPNRYLRELLIPGVDTKFIEARRGLIGELLEQTLPAEACNAGVVGLARHGFERRFGLKYDQPMIRFRLLDARAAQAYGGLNDISLPLEQFQRLNPPVDRVFITENKINGLSFPVFSGSMVIFGLGYGIAALNGIDWLSRCKIQYWGDIDTHGFAMLSQLRGYYPQTRSLLMDRKTLESCADAWVKETAKRIIGELPNLTAEEQACYRILCEDRLGEQVRLEQERVSFEMLLSVVQSA
ncbi:MAG: Wadjet anti-phage system protein JetD domain-containing protein [Sedimenticola sp.]